MQTIHTHLHLMKPIAEETIDTTNRRLRRILHGVCLYNEEEVSPEALADSMIGGESAMAFLGEEERMYRWDDVVFIAPHKVRLHLSRPLQTA